MTLPVSKPQAGTTGWHPAIWNLIDVVNAIDERIRDVAGAAIVGGAGIDATINDAGDTITIDNTSLADVEATIDAVAAAIVAGTNITKTYDDTAGTITIDAAAASYSAEQARDDIGAALVAGTGITITLDDTANTITIAAAAADAEFVRDTIGTALVGGIRTGVTVDDAGNTITINSTGPRVVALTDGATITPNCDTTDIGKVTIAGNRTFAAPSGTPTSGQKLVLRIKQDATGTRTITWNSAYRFAAATPPTLTTTASKTDYLGFIYNSDDSKWDCVAVKLGF